MASACAASVRTIDSSAISLACGLRSSALGNLHARVDRQRRPAWLVATRRRGCRGESLASVRLQSKSVPAAIRAERRSTVRTQLLECAVAAVGCDIHALRLRDFEQGHSNAGHVDLL